LRRGDHVIISDLEHNAVLRPVQKMLTDGIIRYSIAQTYPDKEKTVASFEKLIRPETRLLISTHASNVFGIRMPVEELGMLCRDRDLLFLVDAAQTAGVLPIDIRGQGIDFLCAAGHKSLYGPAGTGILVTSLGSLLDTVCEGGTGSFSAIYDQPVDMPDRLESGTLNIPGILGLGAGIEWAENKGLEALYNYKMRLALKIFEGLKKIKNVALYTPDFGIGTHLPVVSFNIAKKSSEETALILNGKGFALRGGLHCAPLAHKKMGTLSMGAARASIGAFNTLAQAEAFLAAVERVAA
jgi:selenocysteine lyase/cysteine desulfurase